MSRHNRRMGPINPFAAQMNGGANLAMPSQVQQEIMASQQRIQSILNRRDNIMAACIASAFAHVHNNMAVLDGDTDSYRITDAAKSRANIIAQAKALAEDACVAQLLVTSTQFFRDVEADVLEQQAAQAAAQAEQNTVITPDDDVVE